MTTPNDIQPMGPLPMTPDQAAENPTPGSGSTPTQPTMTNQPTAAAPVTPTPQTPANQPHPLSRALDRVLKTATGGDIYYTDPNGQRKLAPQSRGTLGKTLIAATLAGLLAPDSYRETPYGPVRDYTGTAANAYSAGQATVEKMRNRPQQLSDDEQSRKLMTIQNNAHLIALQSASAQLKHTNREQNAQAVDNFMSPFKEYQSTKSPDQPEAFMAQSQTSDQVLQGGHKLTDSNVVQDGWTRKWNEATGQEEDEPTYAVLNPELKDLQLPKNVTDVLAQANSQWQNIHKIVGGNVRVPVNAYVSAMHDYSAVMQGQQVLEKLNQAINGDDAKPLSVDAVAAAARKSKEQGQDLLPALYNLTHAVAGGNLPEDGQRPDNLLHTLLTSGNGSQLLGLIGLTPEDAGVKADEIRDERIRKESLAKTGGMGDKAPATAAEVDALTRSIQDTQDPDIISKMQSFISDPEHMNKGAVARAQKELDSLTKESARLKLQSGDPVELQKTANNVIMGDTTNIKDIMNARGQVKEKANNLMQETARNLGLDPTRYTVSAQMNRDEMLHNYSESDKKVGAQLVSFNTFLYHVNDGYDANESWSRSGSPLINYPIKKLEENFTNNQDYQRFKADIIAPAKEYMNFLNQNRAEHEDDIKSLQGIVNDNASPQSIMTALKEWARTADDRAAVLGKKYLDVVGNTYPVVDGSSTAILERLLGKGNSKAAKVSVAVPRGWQQTQDGKLQAQPLSDRRIINGIWEASGHDWQLATRIAKENGWQLPTQQ